MARSNPAEWSFEQRALIGSKEISSKTGKNMAFRPLSANRYSLICLFLLIRMSVILLERAGFTSLVEPTRGALILSHSLSAAN